MERWSFHLSVRSTNETEIQPAQLMAATISTSPLICLFASMLPLLHETQRFALRKAPARDHLGSADWMDITANFCQWSRRLCHQQVRKFKLMRSTHYTTIHAEEVETCEWVVFAQSIFSPVILLTKSGVCLSRSNYNYLHWDWPKQVCVHPQSWPMEFTLIQSGMTVNERMSIIV